MNRILVVEDDPALARGLVDNLRYEGFEVESVSSAESAEDRLRRAPPDLVLLDLMLPGASGFDLLRKMPAGETEPRVMVVSARDAETDVVRALDLGAHDYVKKPFALGELLARVRAQLRQRGQAPETPEAPLDDVELDAGITISLRRFSVIRDGQSLLLSHTEAAVLELFLRHRGEPLRRSDLLRHAWDDDAQPTHRTVDNFVLKLRRKLERDPARPRHLETVHGVGYVLRRAP